MGARIERVKQHVQDYKVYYSIGAGVVVGVVATIFVGKKLGDFSDNEVLVNSIKQGLAYKSPATNVVVTELERRMHPGLVTQCEQTGEVTASVRKMASNMGVSANMIFRYLRGEIPDVDGYTFKILGEAQ